MPAKRKKTKAPVCRRSSVTRLMPADLDRLAEMLSAEIKDTVGRVLDKTGMDARLKDVDNRLKRLETSDFALNREQFERTLKDLEEGMPGVPLMPT